MSEYIEIESEVDDEDPARIYLYTNLPLTAATTAVEEYDSPAHMAIGSPIAQALTAVEGITRLILHGSEITITRDLDTPEHALIADISAILKDFFL